MHTVEGGLMLTIEQGCWQMLAEGLSFTAAGSPLPDEVVQLVAWPALHEPLGKVCIVLGLGLPDLPFVGMNVPTCISLDINHQSAFCKAYEHKHQGPHLNLVISGSCARKDRSLTW